MTREELEEKMENLGAKQSHNWSCGDYFAFDGLRLVDHQNNIQPSGGRLINIYRRYVVQNEQWDIIYQSDEFEAAAKMLFHKRREIPNGGIHRTPSRDFERFEYFLVVNGSVVESVPEPLLEDVFKGEVPESILLDWLEDQQ